MNAYYRESEEENLDRRKGRAKGKQICPVIVFAFCLLHRINYLGIIVKFLTYTNMINSL